mmetsp:Transcript_16463/g.22990  ORF Transcript_16463/g.22990 Transcript_16463/m.22990 type:complete len:354 (+) Transcript_16463:230-1291(+)
MSFVKHCLFSPCLSRAWSFHFHHFSKASSQRSTVGIPTPRCTTRPNSSVASTMPCLKMSLLPWSKPYLNSAAKSDLHRCISWGTATKLSWFFPPIAGISNTLEFGSAMTTGTMATLSFSNFDVPTFTPFESAFRAFLSESVINLALPAKITILLLFFFWSPALNSRRVVVRVSTPTSSVENPRCPPGVSDLMLTFILDICFTLSVAFARISRNSTICSFSLSFPLSSNLKRLTIPIAMAVLIARFCVAWDIGIVSLPESAPIVCVSDTADPKPDAMAAPPHINCLNRLKGFRTSASKSREISDPANLPPEMFWISSEKPSALLKGAKSGSSRISCASSYPKSTACWRASTPSS